MAKFKTSQLATRYLKGLTGIEIGGSAHNPFNLNTINVDYTDELTIFKKEEIKICGEYMKVDVKAPGDVLPFTDKSYDFVISSHVIEHFYDPIKAITEWNRVASKYIFIICPHKDRTFDRNRPLTTLDELILRTSKTIEIDTKEHYSVFNAANFKNMIDYMGYDILEIQDPDDKVGNGFTFVLKCK